LISFGDFLYTRKQLSPSGYVEEWWIQDLDLIIQKNYNGNIDSAIKKSKINSNRFKSFLKDPYLNKPTVEEAELLSANLVIPLHPSFTFYWSNLSDVSEILLLQNWVSKAKVSLSSGVKK